MSFGGGCYLPKRSVHNKAAKMLTLGLIDDEKIDSINRWMDDPSQKVGLKHRGKRHNPLKVSKALSGKGTAFDPAVLAVSTSHCILDDLEAMRKRKKRMRESNTPWYQKYRDPYDEYL